MMVYEHAYFAVAVGARCQLVSHVHLVSTSMMTNNVSYRHCGRAFIGIVKPRGDSKSCWQF
jgi:hypothetical protein